MIKTMMKEKSSAKHKMGAIQSKAQQIFLRKLLKLFLESLCKRQWPNTARLILKLAG